MVREAWVLQSMGSQRVDMTERLNLLKSMMLNERRQIQKTTLHTLIYIKIFKRQTVDMESRWVMATGWMIGMTEKGHERTLWDDGYSLYNHCGSYTLDIFVKNHYTVQSVVNLCKLHLNKHWPPPKKRKPWAECQLSPIYHTFTMHPYMTGVWFWMAGTQGKRQMRRKMTVKKKDRGEEMCLTRPQGAYTPEGDSWAAPGKAGAGGPDSQPVPERGPCTPEDACMSVSPLL